MPAIPESCNTTELFEFNFLLNRCRALFVLMSNLIPDFSSAQKKHDGWTGPLLIDRLWWISYVYQTFLEKTIESFFFKMQRNRLCDGMVFPKLYDRIRICFSEVTGERRACPGVPEQPRTLLVEQLVKKATGRKNVCNLFTYGCWCGPRGHGQYVDNFD